jgi:uncharacterized protein (DUF1697 family)
MAPTVSRTAYHSPSQNGLEIGLKLLPVPKHAVLLRGINLASRNRISMPELREALEAAGFVDVATYVQSGNVVVSSTSEAPAVGRKINGLIKKRFGFDIAVIVRSHAELAEVVKRNPLAKVALDPKRYLVTFMSGELPGVVVERMRSAAGPGERCEVIGREVYSWHPAGVGRSPLWARIASKGLGVDTTTRNWTTVTVLLAMTAR